MKIKFYCLLSAFITFFSVLTLAQKIENYHIVFDKRDGTMGCLSVSASFTIDFGTMDSVAMNFGGREAWTVVGLLVDAKGALNYKQDVSAQRIIFYKKRDEVVDVRMSYVYINIASLIMYRKEDAKEMGDAELWETSYQEYYYPYVRNTYVNMEAEFLLPDSLKLIASYPAEEIEPHHYSMSVRHVISHSLTWGFYRDSVYTEQTAFIPDTLRVLQIKGMECQRSRFDNLVALTRMSIAYFGKKFHDPYLSQTLLITHVPTFLFHNGMGVSNRNNISFISASQRKFSTYPDIYPLVHEIGHRWIGEWTLLIDDGEPGAYFIKESLNEFMTMMFIRDRLGKKIYDSKMDRCRKLYQNVETTAADMPLIDMKYNNNNVIVYSKGPLVLDHIARMIGYSHLIAIIAQFYNQYKGKPNLHYEDFISVLSQKHPKAGNELNEMIKKRGL